MDEEDIQEYLKKDDDYKGIVKQIRELIDFYNHYNVDDKELIEQIESLVEEKKIDGYY